jgi:alkylated DNA repair dioxygenase AlkB
VDVHVSSLISFSPSCVITEEIVLYLYSSCADELSCHIDQENLMRMVRARVILISLLLVCILRFIQFCVICQLVTFI